MKLEILEAGTTGWSAIAWHRDDPGVRCAVAVGSASQLFNARPGQERPYCVTEDGISAPPSRAEPDSTWMFWWQDDLLDSPPKQLSCPSLKIPKLPKHNDSIYVAFVVGMDGLVEPGGIELESTEGLDASVATLMRLNGCRFRPATLHGLPVRAMVRHHIGLAPHEPEAPPTPEVTSGTPIRPPKVVTALRAALDSVAVGQTRLHAESGAYASDVAGLDISTPWDHAIKVVMLSWGAGGWSAMAFHDSTDTRCAVAVGEGAPAPALFGLGGITRCFNSEGEPFADLEPADEWVAADPPQRKSCPTRLQFRDDPMRRVRVTLEFVVGVDGRPEPRSLRVLEGSGLVDDAGAVQVLSGCSYRPAKERGKAIRVLVRQPVYFN